MTSSHSGHEIAEAFWFRLSLKEVHLSSCLFVFIRVHSWFVFMNDRLFFLERSARHRRDGISWERGRPARILSLWPPLSFSAMLQAATLSAGTASARPRESHGAVPG